MIEFICCCVDISNKGKRLAKAAWCYKSLVLETISCLSSSTCLGAGYNIYLSDFEKISSSFCLFSLGFVAVPYVIDETFELKFHD